MDCYHIALVLPSKRCKENKEYYKEVLSKLSTKLKCCDEEEPLQTEHYALPSMLFNHCNHLFNLVCPQVIYDDTKDENINHHGCQETWINLSKNYDTDFKTLQEKLEEFISRECYDEHNKAVENVADQLHELADNLPCTGIKLNIYWIICEHDEFVNVSNNIPLYGALKRLQMWNNACLTLVFDLEDELCHNFESWQEELDISLANIHQATLSVVDPNIVWCGSITSLQDQKITKNSQINYNWNLSYTSRISDKSVLPLLLNSDGKMENSITVICEMNKYDIPAWKILPSHFTLYHDSIADQIFERKNSTEVFDETDNCDKEIVLLASMKYHRNFTPSVNKTTKDWFEFVDAGLPEDVVVTDKTPCNPTMVETIYLCLYPVEPGIFDVFFIRPEKSLCNLHSFIAVHQASFVHTKSKETLSIAKGTSFERQWLKWLDKTTGVVPSPTKSQFCLAGEAKFRDENNDQKVYVNRQDFLSDMQLIQVQLDASEMLQHFTKDGKPLKKELESLRKQIEEKRTISPAKQEGRPRAVDVGIDYCSNSNLPSRHSFSPKLFPKHVKHETLSICNTPKTLAQAKLQETKRKTVSELEKTTDKVTEIQLEQPSSSNQMEANTKAKKVKFTSKSLSALPDKISTKSRIAKEPKKSTKTASKSTQQLQTTQVKKKKRRSFDGTEESLSQGNPEGDSKEKRSERHRRRLARVVKRALTKYGVDAKEDYFKTCSERLYYLCKSFLKDLKTSEGLNNEMKRLAESNVANVVEFEKRQRETKLAKDKI